MATPISARVPMRVPPVLKAALTSGIVMGAGDIMCQQIQRQTAPPASSLAAQPYDPHRTAKFSIVGLTLHGPYFLFAFRTLDAWGGPSTGLLTAFKKTMLGQLTLFPVYLTAFYMYMGLLEGKTFEQAQQKTAAAFLPTYTTGSVFWPIANMFNFRYVPTTQRVLYVNACGLIWNAILSYHNMAAQKAPT